MSEGNIRGLAKACEVLDYRLVNRILLSNCGVNGEQLGAIVEGMAKLRDFKSLVYKQNQISQSSLDALKPVFMRRIPHHMEEIKLIDCKISPSLIVNLMETLSEQSLIKRLALVNVHHTADSFDKVIEYVATSESLEEIDLSWSIVVKGSWFRFAKMLNENRRLRNLNIGFNQLLEEQSYKLTPEQLKEGLTEAPLSDKNLELLDGFKNFMKYNPYLVHIDL